ncbi:MAG TPA: hypothetical protein DCL54_03430 [Alphaproteobacteria bacterium]|nr:hypothetical protein [Alphaproteobacteria bacterium]HAJ45616.1 hypothetical protein [Alphaproteobacteria bacterium]
MEIQRPLRRSEASIYLLDRHGVSRTPATLAKLAVTGGGPAFRKANRIPIYDAADLDSWAASITSPKVCSTSELGKHARQGHAFGHTNRPPRSGVSG